MSIKPWVRGPFDLLRHGEEHRLGPRDFDRRMALISFDNAIEMAVVTYLDLNPEQRGGKIFTREEVTRWQQNFHTKLEFIERFAASKGLPMGAQRDEMIYYHGLRNDLYHGGNGTIPELHAVDAARRAALWVVGLLFDVDAEALLGEGVDFPAAQAQPASPETEFLAQFLEIRRTLDDVLAALHARISPESSLAERVRAAVPEARFQAMASKVTAEAEQIKQRLVEGQSAGVSDAELQSLTQQLGSLSAYYRERLRSYQLHLIEAAFEATLRKRSSGGVAGLIQQPIGSGITLSLIGYLARCRESEELGSLMQVVVVDRLALGEQLIHSIREAPNDGVALDAMHAGSRDELHRLLLDDRPRLIVATQQLLCTLDATIPHDCIIVGLSLVSAESAAQVLCRLFPHGIFIAFGSNLDRRSDTEQAPLIAEYSLRQAVTDGYLGPVTVELQNSIGRDPASLQYSVDALVGTTACRVIEDFAERVGRGSFRKGIVVTDSLVSAQRYSKALASCQVLESLAKLKICALGQSIEQAFMGPWQDFREGSGPQLLVSTYHRLTGADPDGDIAYYIACSLPASARSRIVAMAGRTGRHTHVPGLIVDFSGNTWNETLSEHNDS